MTRLSDNDWRVLAGVQLGAVKRTLCDKRGVLGEYFTMGDEDVTQSITRLQRAGKINQSLPLTPLTEDVMKLVAHKAGALLTFLKKVKI